MGIGGISVWQLLIILAIVVMLFGTKRLRSMGSDLGAAIKGFRSSMKGDEDGDAEKQEGAEDAEGETAQLRETSGEETGTARARESGEKTG